MGKSGALPEDVDGRFEFIGVIGFIWLKPKLQAIR